MGIPPETKNYSYQISKVQGSSSVVAAIAQSKSSESKNYVGVIFVSGGANSVACESIVSSTSPPDLSTIIVPTTQAGRIVLTGDDMPRNMTVICPKGYIDLNNRSSGYSNP